MVSKNTVGYGRDSRPMHSQHNPFTYLRNDPVQDYQLSSVGAGAPTNNTGMCKTKLRPESPSPEL